ncbi:MAG: superoxide dismutase family protein [Candidatus Sericytochromatia bacterium]|nr:superoxide dismutase family protein [Candidatus Sericytochromatia bacterium]
MRLTRTALPFFLPLAVAGCAVVLQDSHHQPGGRELARAQAAIAGDGIVGSATLIEMENDEGRAVRVVIEVQGDPAKLVPGRHGVHIHAVGECLAPFTSAGGHFDPGPAGNPDPDVNHPYHLGDLPNLVVDERGHGRLDAWTTRVTLSDGPLTVFDADGSALIIHKNPDQGIAGPAKSGVGGGPRVACGVLQR